MNEVSLVTVVVKLVIRAQRWQGAHANAVGKEDLSGSVNPGLTLEQHLPLGGDVVQEPRPGPLEGEGSDQQDSHHEVGEQRREPDDLAGAVETLGDDPVDAEPSQRQAAGQLPLDVAQAVLHATVHLEDAVPGNESINVMVLLEVCTSLTSRTPPRVCWSSSQG